MNANDPLVTRRGHKDKRMRGGHWAFLGALAMLVAGSGVAGLYYGRPDLWGKRAAMRSHAHPVDITSSLDATIEAGAAEIDSSEIDAGARPDAARVVSKAPHPSARRHKQTQSSPKRIDQVKPPANDLFSTVH